MLTCCAFALLCVQVYPRNAEGSFYSIFQPNKWRIKQAEKRKLAELAAAEA